MNLLKDEALDAQEFGTTVTCEPYEILQLFDKIDELCRTVVYITQKREEWERIALENFEHCTQYAIQVESLQKELEDLQQQLKTKKADGWIEWSGGPCPVPVGTPVDVRYRDGEELYGLPANGFSPGWRDAQSSFWRHDSMKNDIVAYRVVKPD